MISEIKCSSFGNLLFILLICIKICNPVEANAEINKLNGNINNIENLNRLKKLYFLERYQSNNFAPLPIKMRMPPPSFSKSSSSTSSKQKYVSSTENESAKTKKLEGNFGRKYKTNNVGLYQMNSNADSSVLSPAVFNRNYFPRHLRPSQTSNVVSKFNDFSSQLADQEILKKRAKIYPLNIINKFDTPKSIMYTDQAKYNFSKSKKSNNLLEGALDPELANIESLSKILKSSDSNMGNEKIIHLKEKTVVMEWERGRNGTKISSERLHNMHQITGRDNQQMQLDYSGKINMNKETKESSTGLKNFGVFSDKFRSFSNQKENIPLINNAKYKKINYGQNAIEIQTLEDFNNELQSFQRQKNSFNLENNLKPQSLYFIKNRENPRFSSQYLENVQRNDKNQYVIQQGDTFGLHKAGQQSNWEMQNDVSKNTEVHKAFEGVNNKLPSFQDQKNILNLGNHPKPQNTYSTGNNENSRFASQYLENSQELENYEDKSDIRKGDEFRLHKAGQQPNWNMQNSVSRNITVEENSETILEKESGESYKSSQTKYVQIFKKNSMHKSLNANHKVLQANNLEHHKEKNNMISMYRYGTAYPLLSIGMLMLIVFIILLLAMFLKYMIAILIIRKEAIKSPDKFTIRKMHACLIKSPNKSLTYNANIKNSSPKSKCVTPNQHSIYLRKDATFRSPSTLDTAPRKTEIDIEAASKSSNQELTEVGDYSKFIKDQIRIHIQDSHVNHLPMPNNLQDPSDVCIKHASMKSKNDSLDKKDSICYKRENIHFKTAILGKKYHIDSETSETSNSSEQESLKEYRIENSVGSPWNLHLRNVKTGISFTGTQYKANQNESVNYPNNQFARDNAENVKNCDYSKELSKVKFSSPKYSNGPFHILETSEAKLAFKKEQNVYSTSKTVHDYPYDTDSESHRQMESPSDLNYLSIKDKIGSPWHRNLVNVKTKSTVLFHNNDSNANNTLHDLKAFGKVDSNSILSISSAQTGQKITSTSDVESVNEMHFYQSNVPSHYSINDRTSVTREIRISPVMNSDSTV